LVKELEDYLKKVKQNSISQAKNLTFVSISKGMLLKTQVFLKNPIKHTLIHNSVNTSIFKPCNTHVARKILNITTDKKLILFISQSLNDSRKGLEPLVKAIETFDKNMFSLLIVGKQREKINLDFETFDLGYITDERLMPLIYSAADIFVTASFQETFGQTTIEAMACGLPVVSFPNYGAKDIITEETGVLADDFTIEALKEAIIKAKNKTWDSEKIITHVKHHFTAELMVNKYISLYNELHNK